MSLLMIVLVFSSCGKKAVPNPEDAVGAYVEDWKEMNFEAMYEQLSNQARETFDEEAFVDRYEKIYQDLAIEDISISYADLSKKEKTAVKKEKELTLPATIKMNSLAGEIEFESQLAFTLYEPEDKEKEKQWQLDWKENLIFPGMENDGKISVERESPRRGEILDRNQMPLAINDVAYEVGIVPEQMDNEAGEIEEAARLLSMSTDKVKEKLDEAWVEPNYFVPLKTIPNTAESTIAELKALPGVTMKEKTGRMYPSAEAVAHLTGHIGPITQEEMEEYPEGTYRESDLIGKRGLEKSFEEKLHGQEGVKIVITTEEDGEKQTEVLAEKPVKDGEHVQLTIDINLQEDIFQSYDGKAGTAAAIQPKTGEILALVSSPAFDPNDFTYGISQSRWDELVDDPMEPFINRFSATFAPGSVLKPITAAVGLKNGTIKPDEGIPINGLTWGKKGWGDVTVTRVSTTEKPVTLEDALKKSDNIYFAMQAVDMGSDKYIKGMKEFGLEEKLPVEFPISTSQISNDGKLDEILLANTSYGQGQIEMSSLHLAIAYTPFMNDGNMTKPNLLDTEKKSEIWKKDLLSKEDANRINDNLAAVVAEGTGKAAKDKDFAISGKTGTAELKASKDSKGHQNGWFVGYPTDDPDILVAMMMEKVENDGGSSYVAGKVKDILKEAKKNTSDGD